MYSCSQVVKSIASDEYLTGGFLKRLSVLLHLAICSRCARYARQLRAIGLAVRGSVTDVSPQELENAKKKIREHLLRGD
jgi:hypothetical protein